MPPITRTDSYLACLATLAVPTDVLRKNGFVVEQLNEEELMLKRRCVGCNKGKSFFQESRMKLTWQVMAQLQRRQREPPKLDGADKKPAVDPHLRESSQDLTQHSPSAEFAKREPPLRCKYHMGQLVHKVWTCCRQPTGSAPCSSALEHSPQTQKLRELVELHQYHPTRSCPPKRSDIRAAVAIDCEMGTALSGDSQLIRITLVDYFTENVLIDSIVEPDVPMLHLNTKYSGITWADIKNARRQGTILSGKEGAREAIWKYVGPHTFVVGHAACNDLRALRWIHMWVVDSLVTEQARVKLREAKEDEKLKEAEEARKAEEVSMTAAATGDADDTKTGVTPREKMVEVKRVRTSGDLSLKTLAKRYLDRDIQTKGKQGHDSLEDAVAARDLVHWNVLNLTRKVATPAMRRMDSIDGHLPIEFNGSSWS
ncbi:hypothetical protein EK21DRAFT_82399 [Setomelanomma holmii]|uniref:Exonuclease domain-containing protein n=1 Tax=Setomelanomma holmii TaxID=210430 RepID=A0A9P4GVK4_9PLEO|nr:hypothetical protein EK21DRAFT_82399 [Setomelanomma holmii]